MPSLATDPTTTTPFASPFCSTPFSRFPIRSLSKIILTSRSTAISCSASNDHISTSPKLKLIATKSKRKLRPSFNEQIRDKWSVKIPSPRKRFPWQEVEDRKDDVLAVVESRVVEDVKESVEVLKRQPVVLVNDFGSNRRVLAPWFHESQQVKIDEAMNRVKSAEDDDDMRIVKEIGNAEDYEGDVGKVGKRGNVFDFKEEYSVNGFVVERDTGAVDYAVKTVSTEEGKKLPAKIVQRESDCVVNTDSCGNIKEPASKSLSEAFEETVASGESKGVGGSVAEAPFVELGDKRKGEESESSRSFTSVGGAVELPWVRKRDKEGMETRKGTRSNTMLAEKSIPEHELKRLRNISLRMLERISVGPAGITQDVVDAVRQKWRTDEVVKLKFEGLSAVNMKRIHEGLERRTGGLVIWRSGGSVVLYRGMTYKLPCAHTYNNQGENDAELSTKLTTSSHVSTKSSYLAKLSDEELLEMSELNLLLDGLGPRFYDWSGPEPLPVDADSLPSFVPGYRPPFRLLPHGAKLVLGNKQMTSVRRIARSTPPHFALGRNRDLQGLAQAMVKLWQTNAIAKIAIKRGVLNTLNEKMAEELKRLTGGTLVSRNKEYIVFHRGNDFLPRAVTETLMERKKLTELHQDQEELARQKLAINFKVKSSKVPLVAGTLAETLAATSRWGSQPTKLEMAKMMKDAALEKRASLVRYLEKKLNLAKSKVAKAEKALRKTQEYLEPKELPTDLEVITDEERFLFRKMGLSMKPFLLVGRRKVFDGTIQNIHLHWKFRELVKLIVKENNFALVKHIAISLEAESGGVLVSVDKTTKGYAIIMYRGKNYKRPSQMRPTNLLTRRQALARSIELQRREALKHHILDLEEKIDLLKSGLEEMKSPNENVDDIEDNDLYTRMTSGYFSDKDEGEDEGEEAYLQVYDGGDEDTDATNSENENSGDTTDNATKINSHSLINL